MKKLFLTTAFIIVMHVAYAQMTIGEKGASSCGDQALNDLASCISSNNIIYEMTSDGNGTVYIMSEDHKANGVVHKCMAQYDQLVIDCPEAPEVVFIKSKKEKK